MVAASRRTEILIFSLVLLGTGYFHQGGGWNQNARFALVRSIVESGTFFIDSHLVYRRSATSPGQLVRETIHAGNFEENGKEFALAWRGRGGELLPVDPNAAGPRTLVAVEDVAASGDVSYANGHFHPNKAPGTSFFAVPGYALVRGVEAMLGINLDSWRVLTWNAWLMSLLSVGLATAFGAVLILQLGRKLGSEIGARLAALAFAFATMAWPYGTFLYEHNLIAVCLLASLYSIERAVTLRRGKQGPDIGAAWLQAAGLSAGFAAITNYTMAALVPMFTIYLVVGLREASSAERGRTDRGRTDRGPTDRSHPVRALGWYALGMLWPLLTICAYNQICFGTPVTTNYAYQTPMFQSDNRILGVFAMPRLDVLGTILISPFRGLFFTSPVLLAAVAAAALMWRATATRALAALIASVTGFLLLVNCSFNGWDGGWTAVPRYLGPAMGLLCVPLALAFDRWRAVTGALAVLAFVIQLLLTSVDVQVPIGDVGIAGIPPSRVFRIDPMTRYVLPLFVREQAWPILHESIEEAVARSAKVAVARGDAPANVESQSIELRSRLLQRIQNREASPFPLAAVSGPVSANPVGIVEGSYFRLFSAGSPEAAGNSFNLGEIVFPNSRLSLLPFFLLFCALLVLLSRSGEEGIDATPATNRPTTKASAP